MEILDKILSNVKKTKKVVIQKSNDVVEITKMKIAINGAENDADELVREIGKLVYDAYKSGEGNAELVEEKCTKLDDIYRDIEEKKSQFAKLRNLKKCDECGRENSADATFCDKCGAKLPEVVSCEVEDMPGGSDKAEQVIVDVDESDE